MKNLLGQANYPYFSGAIAQLFIARYFYFQIGCAMIAVVHLLAEWLYLGKHPQKLQVGLLIGLASAALIGGYWLQPKMKVLHATKYGLNHRPEIREAAGRSFRAWHGVSMMINLLMVGGLTVYLWRATNSSDPTRFVSALKFAKR
jgi:fructose-specific phosphotransferase system IIC component